MVNITGGEAIVKSLMAQGVDTIFGLPGVQNDYFYNAIYDEGDKIRVIHPRHEQGTAYMALGYALSSDKIGVYSVVPGPGFLNTTAALSTAYATNAKVLCLTGEIPSAHIGQGIGLLHEIPDQLGIIKLLTKWAARINSPAEAPELIIQAFQQLHSGRPRPVGLECPMDVLAMKANVDLTPVELETYSPPVNIDAVKAAAKILGQAKQALIFVGSGASHAAEEVKQLAEALQAPVIAGRTGHGILSSRHYLSHTYPVGHHLWAQADVVIIIGSRAQRPLMNWGVDDDLKLVRIDIDPEAHKHHTQPNVSLVADSKEAVQMLLPALEKYNSVRASRKDELLSLKAKIGQRFAHLEPQLSFLKAMREALPEDGIYVDEITQLGFASYLAMPIYKPKTYISSGYQGTLGYGFPTALGVKIAHPDKPVLSIAGDGGFMYNVQELATAVQNQIGLVTLVFNDGAFGNVLRMQKELYDNRIIASQLHNPDFVKLAENFGAQGLRAKTPQALRQAIEKGFEEKGPTLIEIPVEEMPNPWPFIMLPKVRPV